MLNMLSFHLASAWGVFAVTMHLCCSWRCLSSPMCCCPPGELLRLCRPACQTGREVRLVGVQLASGSCRPSCRVPHSFSCALPHEKTAPQWCPSADLTEGGFGQIRRFGAISPRFCCVLPRFWRLPRGRLLNPTLRHQFAALLLQFRTVSQFRTPGRNTPPSLLLQFRAVSHSAATIALLLSSVKSDVSPHFRHTFAAVLQRFAQSALLLALKSNVSPQFNHFCCRFLPFRSKSVAFVCQILHVATSCHNCAAIGLVLVWFCTIFCKDTGNQNQTKRKKRQETTGPTRNNRKPYEHQPGNQRKPQ